MAPRARLRELSPKTMWLTAVVIAVLTAAAVVVLWWPATRALNGADLVPARLDAPKVGLSVAVGSGGVVALYLSWRRRHVGEHCPGPTPRKRLGCPTSATSVGRNHLRAGRCPKSSARMSKLVCTPTDRADGRTGSV
jgi:hypothetical protein